MEKQLVNAERPLAGRQTGLPGLLSPMAGKLTALNVQTLKTWTDAHVSLTLSAALIVVVHLISMMIYPVQTSFVVKPGIGMKILPLSKAKMQEIKGLCRP